MKLTKLTLGLATTLFAACGQTNHQSKVDGHYENASEEQMAAFDGQQIAVPEYLAVDRVMVALPLITSFGREDLINELIKSDMKEIIISVPKDYFGNLNSPEFARLRSMLGSEMSKIKLLKMGTAGDISVWARDWAPLGAVTETNDLRLLDFNYYFNRPADDISPQMMGGMYNMPRVSVPVYNEGGNFMNNENGHCMMSTRVTDANEIRHFAADMILDNDQIADYYQRFAGCNDVSIFPRMPYEGTGHIDMWAKFLDNNTIIINKLTDESMALITDPTQQFVADAQKEYLDIRAQEIANMGYNVVRIPMPLPEIADGAAIVRSYTNSLVANGRALIPQYKNMLGNGFYERYTDHNLISSYEAAALKAYADAGYENVFIDSDLLIATGGAVHCVTMQFANTEALSVE